MPEWPSKVSGRAGEVGVVNEEGGRDRSDSVPARGWLQWIPTSMKALVDAERRLFAAVKQRVLGRFVGVRMGESEVWTVSVGPESERGGGETGNQVPLVMVHGFGGGVGLWAQNLAALSERRQVFAFDLLGFGRSSRPKFSREPTLVEAEWVQSIEDWRSAMGLEKMILLGHSLGGYLASAYAIEHPERVRHLVLVDPWGFPNKPLDSGDRQVNLPTWVRAVARVVTLFTPLASLRAAGPFGRGMVKRFRPDLGRRFASADGEEGPDESAVYDYIYHANVQTPSGEVAFKSLNESFGWAKRPMMERLAAQLSPSVPASFIYGSRSWMDSGPGYRLQSDLRTNSYVGVEVVQGAGHHVYADRPDAFNLIVTQLCAKIDANQDQPTHHST